MEIPELTDSPEAKGNADEESQQQSQKPKKEKKARKTEEGGDKKEQASVTGRWNKEEHDKFIDAIKQYGKDWKQVEQHIESRTGAQIRSHAQKFFNRIIKRYNIEKNEVIDFVHNAYNSNIDSSIQSPKRKKKSIDPNHSKANKQNLYVFNEEPNIAKVSVKPQDGFPLPADGSRSGGVVKGGMTLPGGMRPI